MRKQQGLLIILIALALLLFGGVFVVSAQEAAAKLSGITVDDKHPNGCVDCHKNSGDGKDYRLNVELKNLTGHPDVTNIVKTVPKDCMMCHKPNTKAGALNHQTHKFHYQNPKENHFIMYYQGECLACHTLDSVTGIVGLKSGSKNW